MTKLLTILLLIPFFGFTQIDSLSSIQNWNQLNDVWGYEKAGSEYAVVGHDSGVAIVDVTIPTAPVVVQELEAPVSATRDVKTKGNYLYSVCERDSGLLIYNLNNVGISDQVVYYQDSWSKAHNIWLDENDILYVCGADEGNGGVIFYDVSDPVNPVRLGDYTPYYVHDVYVRGDTAYLANIVAGIVSVVDVSNKSNPVLLGSVETSTRFAHNTWVDASGTYLFTTDERSGSFIDAYDVSDPSNIEFLDKVQDQFESEIIPHNVLWKDSFLYVSYYTEGIVVFDAADPENLIKVGAFDTHKENQNGEFGGVWGIYPFLPSGNILASDMQNGLYVFGDQTQRASRLKGKVTSGETGFVLQGVKVSIENVNWEEQTDLSGNYKTGLDGSGTIQVSYSKVGYYPQTIAVAFTRGQEVIQDVVLQKLPSVDFAVQVLDFYSNDPVEDVIVLVNGTGYSDTLNTNVNGMAAIPGLHIDSFQVICGKWGYHNESIYCVDSIYIDENNDTITLFLEQGYYDNFSMNLGWTTLYGDDYGKWAVHPPVVSKKDNNLVYDPEQEEYVSCLPGLLFTGPSTNGNAVGSSVDHPTMVLSPPIPVSELNGTLRAIFFDLWWAPDPSATGDSLDFGFIIGSDTVSLEMYAYYEQYQSDRVWGYVEVDPSMEIQGVTGDVQFYFKLIDVGTPNLLDAAIDNFEIAWHASTNDANEAACMIAYNVGWQLPCGSTQAKIYDLDGRLIFNGEIQAGSTTAIQQGIYIVQTNYGSQKVLIYNE